MAHATVVTVHALCCGVPVLALILTGLSGLASAASLVAGVVEPIHAVLHSREMWILGLSAILVAIGAWLEFSARRRNHGLPFPWLFALSASCLAVNAAVIAAH